MPPRPNGPRLSMKESMKQLDKKTLFRLLSYMKPYRLHLVFVFICIAVSAFASVMSSLFLKSLIDDYISPLLLESNPNFSGLLYALLQMAVIYVIGAFSTLFYNRTMAVVSQGTLKKIRDEMFEHMQTLPIKFFSKTVSCSSTENPSCSKAPIVTKWIPTADMLYRWSA